jgi:hypothetical protein
MKLHKIFLTLSILAALMGCYGGNNESSNGNNNVAIQTPKTTYGFFRNLQPKTTVKAQVVNGQTVGNPSITMATAREGHKAISIGNGKFMLIGGERIVSANGQDLPSSDPSVIDIFDSNTEQFTHLDTITNVSRQWSSGGGTNFAMVQMPNNKILIIGGASNGISETIEVFDPLDNSIQLITGVFPERSINNVDHAFYIGNNKVLLVGTYFIDNNGLHNKGNAVIDLTTMTGSFINTPYNAINGNAVQLSDRSVIYAGGNDPTIIINFYSDIYRIDPNTLETTKIGNMLFPRSHFGMTVLPNGNIGIYGGLAHINATFGQDEVLRYKSVEIINTTTWIPSLSVDLLGYRSMTLPTVLQTGNVLVAGGVNEIGRPADSEFVHNSESNLSAFTGNLTTPRMFYSVIPLNNGRILISGGLSDIGATNTAEIYDPAAKLPVTYDTSTTISVSTDTTPSIVHFTSTGTKVTWSINGNGTIDANGVYTAPTSPSVDIITGSDGTNSTQVTITSIQ